MTTPTALVPDYMHKFKCIGSLCEDSCCIGWGVELDKKTYDSLTKIPNRRLREAFRNGMEKRSSERTNANFAVMKMNEATGCCSMLNEQKLCTIQAEMGEGYLAPVCATYPRNIHYVNGNQEISAVMSCPEAARIALLNPEKMTFSYMTAIEGSNVLEKEKLSVDHMAQPSYMRSFWDLRVFTIEVLQNRDFAFPHRMIILGLFCEEIQKLIDKKQDTEMNIQNTIEQFRTMIESNQELKDYNTFPADQEFQFVLLNNIISRNLDSINSNQRFKECVEDYLEGMSSVGIPHNSNQTSLVDLYANAFQRYYQPFMGQHEYIMENYAVNFIYSHLFPKSQNSDLFENYILLVSHFALIKLLLVGGSAKHRGLTTDIVLKAIQSFTKISVHSNVYIKHVMNVLSNSGFMTMGHMSLLIKN